MVTTPLGEALLLGLASGPACVAACGPVLVPSLLAERGGLPLNVRYLGAFLSTRLLGYLLFAAAAWEVGTLTALRAPTRGLVFAVVHLLLGAVLLRYAYSAGRACNHSPAPPHLVTIGAAGNHRLTGAAALGLLTGISLCPPFVAAGIRAAGLPTVVAALLFFASFFVGTSVWFVPFAGFGWLRRNEALTTVARMTMALIALFYFYAGLMTLIEKNSNVG